MLDTGGELEGAVAGAQVAVDVLERIVSEQSDPETGIRRASRASEGLRPACRPLFDLPVGAARRHLSRATSRGQIWRRGCGRSPRPSPAENSASGVAAT